MSYLRTLVKKIKNNYFLINIITLISGTALSQGIMFFATPFLSRLYTPGEYGNLTLFLAIVGTISVVASWKYELAIMLPKKDEDANALLFISVLITILMSVVTFLIMFIGRSVLAEFVDKIDLFIIIVPIGVLLNGLYMIFINYNTRNTNFKNITVSKISKAIFTVLSQVVFKIGIDIQNGLLFGNILGLMTTVCVLISNKYKKNINTINSISTMKMKENMRKYDQFPKYQSFSALLNNVSNALPVFVFSSIFDPEVVGFYGMTIRIIGTPSALISGSVRQAYYQRASGLYAEGKNILSLFYKSTINLTKLAILPYSIIAIFGVQIFSFLFGAEWAESGQYAQLIAIWSFISFINPPAVMTIQVLGLQKMNLIYEILLILSRLVVIYSAYYIFENQIFVIGSYSLVGFAFNLFLIVFIYNKLRCKKYKHEKKQ